MKIACINALHNGSTGNIMRAVAAFSVAHGDEAITYSSCSVSISVKNRTVSKPQKLPNLPGHRYFGGYFSNLTHVFLGILTGRNGCFSILSTAKLLRELKKMKPDLIHLHNLHGFCLNLPMLFRYLKKGRIPVVWTLHDCWAFTGRCPHFSMLCCEKWKSGCGKCPYPKHSYPASYLDCSARMWKKKKSWFTGMDHMTLVAPSKWLADLTKDSFLGAYPLRVIHNGIDLSVFRPTLSDVRERYGIPASKRILLGVSFDWGKRKGLDVMLELNRRLGDAYQLILVGTDDALDAELPPEILSIHRTDSQKALAELYSAADVFVNPTREDNYPTVNMEAIACGTPVVTFNSGGSPEALGDDCGIVVQQEDIDGMIRAIMQITSDRERYREACLTRAKTFDKDARYTEYWTLFHAMYSNK